MTNDTRGDKLPTAILDLVKRSEKLLARQASAHPSRRMLVALAGVPGAGKSTVSDALLSGLAARGIRDVAVVPMVRRCCSDGYEVLTASGRFPLYPRGVVDV